jgi:hypothetical protein
VLEEGEAHEEAFCGNVLLFWNAHPKGFFFWGIWEHLLASKMLLGRVKPLPRWVLPEVGAKGAPNFHKALV